MQKYRRRIFDSTKETGQAEQLARFTCMERDARGLQII